MAGSVEVTADAGAPTGGGLDELIRALARYSAGLERVAARLGGGGDEALPTTQSQAPRSAPTGGSNPAFQAIAEWFRRQAPQASRIASAFAMRPRAQERASALPLATTSTTETLPTTPPIELPATPAPAPTDGGLLASLMRQLVDIAQGIARKMGVVTAPAETPAPAQPAPAPVETPGETPVQTPAEKQPTEPTKAPGTPPAKPEKNTPKGGAEAPKTGKPPEPKEAVKQLSAGTKTPPPSMIGQATGTAGAAVGGLAAGLGAALAAPLVFAEVVSGVASKITGFVAAINPGLVQTLGLAFRDLTAVVGIALQPILQAIVPVIKQFTNAIFPLAKTVGKLISEVFEALQPAIDALTDTFFVMAETLQPVVQLIGDTLKFLAPIFTLLANVVKQVYVTFGAMVAAIVGVTRGLFGAVDGGGFKDAMQGLQDGLKLLTAALIRGLGYLLKFFGSIAGLNSMINFLKGMNKPRENAQGIAAAQNAQFSSIEQLGKSAALASVIATATPGGAGKENKTDQDFFAGMIEELESIKDNGPDLIKAVEALPGQIGTYLAELPPKIGKYVADAINSASKEAPSAAANLANPLPMGSMASWLISGSSASFITKPGG